MCTVSDARHYFLTESSFPFVYGTSSTYNPRQTYPVEKYKHSEISQKYNKTAVGFTWRYQRYELFINEMVSENLIYYVIMFPYMKRLTLTKENADYCGCTKGCQCLRCLYQSCALIRNLTHPETK